MTAPTVSLTTLADGPFSSAFSVTATFSESVTGFGLEDLVVGNATVSNFLGSGSIYTFDVTPEDDGDVTVDVVANVAFDSAGNGNAAAAQLLREADLTAPTVGLANLVSGDLVGEAFTVTATFSEAVTGFELSDVEVGNGIADNFQGSGSAYSFDVRPTRDGDVTVSVGAGVAFDSAGNGNLAASTLRVTADLTASTVTLDTQVGDFVSGAFTVTATFSEAVTGFDAGDVVVTNASLDQFTGSGASYSFDVTPTSDGVVTVDVAAGAAQDGAGNATAAAAQLTRTADFTVPTVTLQTSSSEPVGGTFSVTAEFSENVSDFALDDLILTNAQGDNLVGSGSVYTFDVIPAATGTVTIAVAEEGVQDRAGNGNQASDQLSVAADLTSPTVSLATSATSPVGTTFSVSATFSEDVTDFDASDVDVANGSLDNFSGSGRNYSFDVTPISNGEVTVDVGAGVAQDAAGNGNAAAASLVMTADLDGPTLGLSTTASNPVAGEFTVTATFSESVTGFELNDIVVGNGIADNFQGTGSDYSFDVTPASDGDVTVDVAAGVAFDSAGNGNAAAAQLSRTADMTAPTVSLTTLTDGPFSGIFSVTVTFSEPVTGFGLSDVFVSNGTLSNLLGSGSIYTFNVTPVATGNVTLDVVAGVAFDSAGNGNVAAAQLLREADLTVPTVGLATDAGLVGGTFTVTATFSESVTGFELGDIVVGNGSAGSLEGSGQNYSFDVTPTRTGDVTVDVAAGVAVDSAGNGNTAASTLRVTADLTSPTVSLATSATSPVGTTFSVSATFSEDVTDFDSSDVEIGNGSLGNFSGSGRSYSFDVTPTSNGEVTVDVAAGVAQDAAGNGNAAATPLSLTADLDGPTLGLSTTASNPVAGEFTVTATFSESVTGFELGDIVVGNGTADNFSGSGASYSFDVTPEDDGDVTVDVVAGVAFDGAGNGNAAAAQLSRTADMTAPTVSLTTLADGPFSSAFSVTVAFSESVTGFELSDVVVGNGTLSNFLGSGSSYTFDVMPLATGDVTVDVVANVAFDSAGNGNAAAAQLLRKADLTAPTVGLATSGGSNVVGSEFTVTATFSESVTGFELGDIVVGNGTADNFQGTGSDYSFDVTPASDGDVTVSLGAGVAFDSAGNGNLAASTLSVTADLTASTVTLDTQAGDFVSGAFTVTATFDEAVTGFELNDVVVTNASLDQFTGSGASYSFDVTPISDGVVTVDVVAGAAQDGAGNATAAAAQLTRTADFTVPTVTLQTSAPEPIGGTFSVTAEFSEEVSDFALDDLILTNAVGTNLVGSGKVYSFNVTPAATGTVTILVAEEGVQDRAGNGNEASDQLSLTADLTSPTVSLATSATSPVGTTFSVSATFSEDVTDFDSSDVEVGNGSVGNFQGSGQNYSFDVTPTSNGEVTVDVGAGVAQDAAGNGNAAATPLSLTADLDGSTLGLSTTASNPVAGEFTVTATFSESVTGFGLGDIEVGNGTADNFQGTGSDYSFDVTPASDGEVTVDVAAGVAFDSAGNGNAAAAQLSRTADMTAPTVSLTTLADGPFSSAFSVTVEFSESVTGFELSDVVVGNGTLSNFLGSGSIYTFDVTPTSDGDVTVDVVANVAFDSAGNGNAAAAQLLRKADLTAPTVGLAMSGGSNVVGEAFTVTATFSESVTGFELGDIVVGNGVADNLQGTGSDYSFDVRPTSDGDVTVSLGADVAFDSAGNGNLAASTLRVTADLTTSTVTLDTQAGDFVSGTFTVTATFSEAVTGFELNDVVVTNASLDQFTGSGASYSFDVTPASDGDVTVDVAAGVAFDSAGNGNAAAAQLSRTADMTGPTFDEGDYNFNWPENASGTIATVVATDTNGPLTYSLTGGADAGLFSLTEGGALSFGANGSDSADYENPDDANQDNIYELRVTAWDGVSPANGTVQDVTVTVTNVVDEEDTDPIGVRPAGGSDIDLSSDDTALTLEEDTYQEVEVRLIEAPADTVTILVSSSDTEIAKVSRDQDGQQLDSTSLTFELANWTAPQSFWIAGVDQPQKLADFDATINMSFANSADAGYRGLNDLRFVVEVTNAAGGGVGVNTSASDIASDAVGGVANDVASDAEVQEGGETIIRVDLTAEPLPGEDVTVTIVEQNAEDGAKLSINPTPLTFDASNWNVKQDVTLEGLHDDDDEDEFVTVALTASGGGYNDDVTEIIVWVQDDDAGVAIEDTDGVDEGDTGSRATSIATSEVMGGQLGDLISDAVIGGLARTPTSRDRDSIEEWEDWLSQKDLYEYAQGSQDGEIGDYRRLHVLSARDGGQGFSLVDWFSVGLSSASVDAELQGDGTFAYAMVGREMFKTVDMVGGLLYGVEASSWNYEDETDVDRAGFSLGYYGAWNNRGLIYTGSSTLTLSQNDFLTTARATGDARSYRLILKGGISGERALGTNATLKPYVDLMYASEQVAAFTFSDGTTSAKSTTDLGRLGVGLEYATNPSATGDQFIVRGELSQVFGVTN